MYHDGLGESFEVAYNSVSDRMTDLNNGGEGIDAKNECKNGKIHHNIVFNMLRVGVYVDAYQRNLSNIEVYANKVYDCTRGGITVASEEGGIANGVKIHDNLVYNINRIGIRLAGYLNNGPLMNIDVYHNTVFNAGFGGGYENAGILIEASNDANSGFNIRNNIISGCPQQIRSNNKQNFAVTVDNNVFFGQIGTFSANTTVTNTINADPLFVNTSLFNFKLQQGSPAIDEAVGVPVSPADFDDLARPVGDQSDLGAFEYVSAVLPVTLISFAGRLEEHVEKQMVALKWSTVSEINVSEYVIEKGNNPLMFEAIGSVSANNTIQANSYKFNDWDMGTGLQYYRLKMKDLDDTFEYSKIIAIDVSGDKLEEVVVFPNPATNSIIVRHESSPNADGLIQMISSGGNIISKCSVLQNTTETKVDINSLAKGSYVIIFERSGVKTARVFIK